MSKPEAAKEFLQELLPLNIKSLVNLDTIKLQRESFVDEKLREYLSDILYSVDFGDQPGYVYCLFEHQSTSDQLMAFRLLKYVVNVMEYHLKQTKSKKLPIVYPIVYYTGNAKYTAPRTIFDLFEEKERKLAEEIFLKPYKFVDVKDLSDERLRNYVLFGLMSQIFKSKKLQSAEEFANIILKRLIKIDENGDVEYIKTVIQYVFKIKDIKEKDKLLNILIENLSETAGESIMTIAQQLKQEGRQEGRYEGSVSFVKYLLMEGKGINEISELTGLSITEINKIKSEEIR